jgi:hypothetical protein
MASTPHSTTIPPATPRLSITQQFEGVIAEFSNLGPVLQAASEEAHSDPLNCQQLIGAAQYMFANLDAAFAAVVETAHAAARA